MFSHLHVHSEYSVLDGLGKPEQWITKAKELGYEYLGITDHASIDGLLRFRNASKKLNGPKIICGCELYIVPNLYKKEKGEKRGHVTVFIKNNEGLKNINKMLTIANLEGYYNRPRIDYENFLKNCGGLCVLTGCSSSFLLYDTDYYFFKELYQRLKDDLYMEIMPFDIQYQRTVNEIAIELSKKFNLKTVATNDCHYPLKGYNVAQEVLLAIQSKKKWNDKTRWKFDLTDLYLKTTEEMFQSFHKLQYIDKQIIFDSIRNTQDVVNKCKDFEIENYKVDLPSPIHNENDLSFLIKLCKEGFEKKIRGKVDGREDEYYARYLKELRQINKLKFTRYFLIIWDLINWCKNHDILTGPGRGSSSGSLISYLLGITGIDPIKYGLIFERFISEDRVKLPDIDIDFEDRKRKEVRKYLEDKYGQFHVAGITTFLRMKAKMVIRDVSRVFDVPIHEVNEISELVESKAEKRGVFEYEEKASGVLKDYFETDEKCIKFKNKYPEVAKYACILENQIRGYGQHAAGVVISNSSLKDNERCNLVKRNGTITVNWEKDDAESMGLIKIDILGLSNLSIMSETMKMIKENYNKEVKLEEIRFDDENIQAEYEKGNFVGIFQFNGYGFTNLIRGKYGTGFSMKNFEDSCMAVALVRPATIYNGMLQKFVDRRAGRDIWDTKYEILKKILGNSHGIIIYQEQLMKIINEVAGMSYTDADKIRKFLEWNDYAHPLDPYKEKFIEGCIKTSGFTKSDAEQLWNDLVSYGGYSFNLSHSTAYATIAWYNMWFKVYYPAEFLAATLSFSLNDKKLELLKECFRLGLIVMSPKKKLSRSKTWYADKNKIIYMPLIELKGIGEVFSQVIEEQQKMEEGFFKSDKRNRTKIMKILHEIKFDDLSTAVFYDNYYSFNLSEIFRREYRQLYREKGFNVLLDKET